MADKSTPDPMMTPKASINDTATLDSDALAAAIADEEAAAAAQTTGWTPDPTAGPTDDVALNLAELSPPRVTDGYRTPLVQRPIHDVDLETIHASAVDRNTPWD